MDRLLTPNEQPNIPQDTFSIYDWKTALQIYSHINEVKKLQDAKTASLVAQEIFDELNKPCTHNGSLFKRECITCKAEIRSKYIEGKNG